jgi:D-threo-aldose 1-dehydrogenase
MADTAQPAMHPVPAAELGFGCARLLMQLGEAEALNLLAAALEAGIRHVDVARSYGDGRTEAVVGQIARRRRWQMTIVTKAGLAPPNLLSRARRKAAAMTGTHRAAPSSCSFEPSFIRRSVEQSLRSLGTDYLDALLLHDCALTEISDGLRALLMSLKQSGMVRKLGVAASAQDASAIAAAYPGFVDVIQVAAASYNDVKPPAHAQVITHSVFAHDADGQEPGGILRQALSQNAGGVVLFSSSNLSHIRCNASIAQSLRAVSRSQGAAEADWSGRVAS